MKKQIIQSIAIVIAVLFLASCGGGGSDSADTTAPVITIVNGEAITVNQNSNYVDAGATAIDNIDGAVSVTSSGSVNTAIPGT